MLSIKFKPKFLLSILSLALVMCVFLGLRWWGIRESLFFFNDMGRDFLVLLDWQQSGKPPLLGPQTSVVSYNQSALYFYLLFPAFVLTHHWPLSSLLSCSLAYILVLIAGWWYWRRKPSWQWWWLACWWGLSLMPQLVTQHRFVWNPSFVTLSLVIAIAAWWQWREQERQWQLALFGVALAASTAFSYSAAPALVAWMIWAGWLYLRQWRKLVLVWSSVVIGLALVNLPTIVFEIRHSFFLTRLLIFGQKQPQLFASAVDKVVQLLQHAFDPNLTIAAGLLVLTSVVVSYAWWNWSDDPWTHRSQEAAMLLLLTMIVTWLVPFSLQSHYVFPILTLWVLTVITLPSRPRLVLAIILTGFWLRPSYWQSYTKPAPRSIAQLLECAEISCQQWSEPTFMSAQAGGYPYHNAMDFKYAFKEAGCDIKELDTQISEASYMLVVVDDSVYQHQMTDYNELTQFGPSQEVKRWSCNPKLDVVVLQRNSTQTVP